MIELLIVVAIIGILAALLLPTLEQARKSACGVKCRSNQKQLGLAFSMYCDTNAGYYPMMVFPDYKTENSWVSKISDNSSAIVECPVVAPRIRATADAASNTNLDWHGPRNDGPLRTVSYIPNGYLIESYTVAAGEVRHRKESRLKSASTASLLFDLYENILQTESTYAFTKAATIESHFAIPGISGNLPRVGYPHRNAVNILWADGHVGQQDNRFATTSEGRLRFVRDHLWFEGSLRAEP